MGERVYINAEELLRTEAARDGQGVCLHLVDDVGRTVVLRLPAGVVRAVGDIAPPTLNPAGLHPVESWQLRPSGDGASLVLTLHTADGSAASYVMRSWQIEGIATLAAHSHPARGPSRLMN